MNKATTTSPEAMTQEQITKDISMTPEERLEMAFQLSDFTLSVQKENSLGIDESSAIEWIELNRNPSSK